MITIMIPNPSFLLIVVSCDFMIHQLMAKLREYGRTHIFGYYYPAFRQTQVIDLDLPKTFKIANGSFFFGDLIESLLWQVVGEYRITTMSNFVIFWIRFIKPFSSEQLVKTIRIAAV